MKRIGLLLALVAFGDAAHAGEAISFKLGGRRVTVEAPRNCRSLSCVTVAVPGVSNVALQGGDARSAAPPPPQVASAPVPSPVAVVAPAAAPVAVPVSVPAAPVVPARIESTAAIPAVPASVARPTPAPALSASQAIDPPRPAVDVPSDTADRRRPQPTARDDADDPDSPRGDWQGEGDKGTVRIRNCGTALCGYVLDADGSTTGETVLVNMKPKGSDNWSGTIVSRASGESYYATMTLKDDDTLRVEACAFWHFVCSGNDWTRIAGQRTWATSWVVSRR